MGISLDKQFLTKFYVWLHWFDSSLWSVAYVVSTWYINKTELNDLLLYSGREGKTAAEAPHCYFTDGVSMLTCSDHE